MMAHEDKGEDDDDDNVVVVVSLLLCSWACKNWRARALVGFRE